MFSKDQLVKSAERSLNFFGIQPLQTALLCLPVQYIAGMMMVVRAFTGNLNLITCQPELLKNMVIEQNIDFAAMVPIQIESLVKSKVKIDFFHKILIGGAEFKGNLAQLVKDNFKANVWETYGMTETLTQVAVRTLDEAIANQPFKALPEITFTVDDRNCLVIHDKLIQSNKIVTNDFVELQNEKSFKFLGRVDNVINSGGIKIFPENIEKILTPYIIGKFCISSLPDKKFGEILVLVAEKNVNKEKIEASFEKLDKFLQPKKIITLTKLPESRNGKLDRKAVRQSIIDKKR